MNQGEVASGGVGYCRGVLPFRVGRVGATPLRQWTIWWMKSRSREQDVAPDGNFAMRSTAAGELWCYFRSVPSP